MAIAETSRIRTVFGNKTILIITGTYANGDTTGTIDTGLKAVDFAAAQYVDAAKIINCSASAGVVTLATQDPTATKTWKMIVVGH
jgi:hypothetical protein